jgi:hypothetical protein
MKDTMMHTKNTISTQTQSIDKYAFTALRLDFEGLLPDDEP